MYDNTTKNQFIELRAQGLALDAISEQIGVPKPTLGRWNLECLEDIQRLRAIQWELLEDQMGQRFEDSLKRIAQRIRRLEDELDTRKPQNFTRVELVRVIRQSRLEYLKLRSILMAPLRPTRGRTPCVGSLDSPKRDKTRQDSESLDTTLLQQNDLQQTEPAMSHSEDPVTHEVTRGPISTEPSANPNPSSADAVHDSPPSQPLNSSVPSVKSALEIPTSQHSTLNESADESVVIGPDDSAASIVEKCGLKLAAPPHSDFSSAIRPYPLKASAMHPVGLGGGTDETET